MGVTDPSTWDTDNWTPPEKELEAEGQLNAFPTRQLKRDGEMPLCPKCGAEDVSALTDGTDYLCLVCDHPFQGDK